MRAATFIRVRRLRPRVAAWCCVLILAIIPVSYGGNPEEASQYFKSVVSPTLKANDDSKIETALNRCLEIDPRNYRALCSMALFKLGKGDWREAINYFSRAKDVAPNKKTADALESLANVAQRCQSQDVTEGDKQKRKYTGHMLMAKALLKARRYDEALIQANKAIATSPMLWDAYVSKAAALRGQKRIADVKLNLAMALELAPENVKPKIQVQINKLAQL